MKLLLFITILFTLSGCAIFSEADKNPSIRQLYEISHLGEANNKNIITPKWMKIEAQDSTRVDKKDFRDELKIKDGEKLIFNIFVASRMVDEKKEWMRIGTITLSDSVVSKSCDRRLHFHHPKWRDDLVYGDN